MVHQGLCLKDRKEHKYVKYLLQSITLIQILKLAGKLSGINYWWRDIMQSH